MFIFIEKNEVQEGPSPVCEAARFGWLWLFWLWLLWGENKVKSYFVGFAQNISGDIIADIEEFKDSSDNWGFIMIFEDIWEFPLSSQY